VGASLLAIAVCQSVNIDVECEGLIASRLAPTGKICGFPARIAAHIAFGHTARRSIPTWKKLMHAIMLKAKLHRAEVTHAVLDYEGSCAIDGEWLDLSGIREYEQIQIYNVDNGERFTTYAIRGEEGSRMISVNGAAAHKAKVGDRVIICAYAHYSEAELLNFKPRMLYMAPGNELSHTSNAIPVQVA
jgi:aspartate 1-decarboxylase